MQARVAFLELSLMDDGSMSITGNVGDVKLALGMLDSARASVAHRFGKPCILEPHGAGLVVPNRDVVAPANERIYPLTEEVRK